MKYVIDASVSLKWVLPEVDSGTAIRLRSEAHAGLHLLLSTDFYPLEASNALTRAERRSIIPVGDADRLLLDVFQTPPMLCDSMIILRRATQISPTHRHGLYDCVYVALAERQNCKFITADTQLVANLQPTFPFIVRLADLP